MKNKISLVLLGSALLFSSLGFISFNNPSIVKADDKVTKETEITSSTDARNLGSTDPIAPNGRRFTFIIPTGATSYEQVFKGTITDLGHQSYDVTFKDVGSGSGGRQLLCYIPSRLNSIIISSDNEYALDGDPNTVLKFTKSYKVTYPSQEYTPAIIEEYSNAGISIVGSTQGCNVNESFAKRWYDLLIPSGTSYNSEYTGYIYDTEGEKYEARLKDVGSYEGKRKLRFAIPLRIDIMCIYSSTLFYENTTKEPIFFDLDYQVKYPKIEYRPATVTTFVRPCDLNLSTNILEGKHSFTSLSFTGDIHYKEGDLIPSYASSLSLKITKTGEENKNTKVQINFDLTNKIEQFVIKRGTIFKNQTAGFDVRCDKSYLLTLENETYKVESFDNSKSIIKLGNTGNTRSWATSPLTQADLPYISLISFTDSLMKGLYTISLSSYYYTGFVYDSNDNQIQTRLWLISPSSCVDITTFKLGIYIASNEKSFKIKKDELFSQEGVSSLPAFISFDENYLVNFTANTSNVEVTILGEGGGEVTDIPPTITYNGASTLYFKEGDCVPLILATAKDYYNQDVLIKKTYSAGACDARYRLLKGNHTITLTAKDKYKNVSTLVINLVVS